MIELDVGWIGVGLMAGATRKLQYLSKMYLFFRIKKQVKAIQMKQMSTRRADACTTYRSGDICFELCYDIPLQE